VKEGQLTEKKPLIHSAKIYIHPVTFKLITLNYPST